MRTHNRPYLQRMAKTDVAPEVRALSAALLPEVEAHGRAMADLIRATVPAYADDRLAPFDTVVASTTANLRDVLEELAGLDRPSSGATRATGAIRAESGVPYDAVLQAFRVGGRFIWELLVSHATSETREALLRAAADIWAVTDRLSLQVTESYRAALSDQVRRDGQRRTALVGAVLGGEAGESDELWRSAGVLGMRRSGTFVVVSAECLEPGTEGLPGIEQVLRRHNVTSAWRLEHDRQDGLVELRRDVACDSLAALVSTVALGRVGVSTTFDALTRAPEALREARIASTAAAPGTRELVRFDEHPLAVLLATAPGQAEALARSVLGPVLDLPAEDRDLLVATARTWLVAGGSTSTAARDLHLHRNTVRYRLKRIEQLTGLDLGHPVGLARAHVALECARIHGLA